MGTIHKGGRLNDMEEAAARQLALDLNCYPEDFMGEDNKVSLCLDLPGRRRLPLNGFFHMACMGRAAVAMAEKEMIPFSLVLLEHLPGPELFDAKSIYVINQELEQYGKALGAFHQYYLPDCSAPVQDGAGWNLTLYEGEELEKLYACDRQIFSDALIFDRHSQRRDMLAAAAWQGSTLMGIAGATNDSDIFWQIGVDVLPAFRQKGLAVSLVSRLTREILMRGAVPYYGTWWSNIASRRVARACGYYPAWVETYAIDVH